MADVTRKLSDIPGLEDYGDYFVTINGDIFSTKWNKIHKLKPSWGGSKKDGYAIVKLSNNTGKVKTCYVHRIVASAFLPNPSNSWGIYHKDGDLKNNALTNLEWIGRKVSKESDELDTDTIRLNKQMSDMIKLVHYASVIKGIPVPAEIEFFHNILNESLEEYINRYGLRKTMYQIENGIVQ